MLSIVILLKDFEGYLRYVVEYEPGCSEARQFGFHANKGDPAWPADCGNTALKPAFRIEEGER